MYLTLCLGPMFSGKTSFCINKYRQYKKKGCRLLVVNHQHDIRYGNNSIINHDGLSIPAISMSSLLDIDVSQYDVIIVDEGQFFPDLLDFVKVNMKYKDTRVYISGLQGDINCNKFGYICDIIPYCSDIKHFKSICDICANECAFTGRKGNYVEQTVIGGDDLYYNRCHNHVNI